MNYIELAKQIKELDESVVIIYAFNNTGKTRLSVAYKDYTKSENNGNHSGVYYNAFSEDLFVWDNDEPNNNANIVLTINKSSISKHHYLLNEIQIREKLEPYNPRYDFYFNPHDNPEDGIKSITFFLEGEEDTPIKISRGEERIFIWCFFLALFDVEGWADQQNEHFFIDDPVSSLDDHNIFVTALTIFNLIEKHLDKRKIIFTTHHMGIASIISDWLSKGELKDKFINRNKTKKYKQYILENNGDNLELSNPRSSVLLYHLRLLQLLNQAVESDEIYIYHFALLRQALENIASFLGVGQFSFVIKEIGITDVQKSADIINALSHQKVYYHQNDLPLPANKLLFVEVIKKLKEKYNFVLHD